MNGTRRAVPAPPTTPPEETSMVARTNSRFYFFQWLLSGSFLQSEERRALRHVMNSRIGGIIYNIIWTTLLVWLLISTIGLLVVSADPAIGMWLVNQEWFQAISRWWQNSWPGQFFEWALGLLPS